MVILSIHSGSGVMYIVGILYLWLVVTVTISIITIVIRLALIFCVIVS